MKPKAPDDLEWYRGRLAFAKTYPLTFAARPVIDEDVPAMIEEIERLRKDRDEARALVETVMIVASGTLSKNITNAIQRWNTEKR